MPEKDMDFMHLIGVENFRAVHRCSKLRLKRLGVFSPRFIADNAVP